MTNDSHLQKQSATVSVRSEHVSLVSFFSGCCINDAKYMYILISALVFVWLEIYSLNYIYVERSVSTLAPLSS